MVTDSQTGDALKQDATQPSLLSRTVNAISLNRVRGGSTQRSELDLKN